jgi:dienelactone hydrolase
MELMLPQPELQPQKWGKGRRLLEWVVQRYAARKERDTYIWRVATGGLALFASIAMTAATLGMPTGLPMWVDLTVFIVLNLAVMFGATLLAAILLSMFYVPLPRRFVSALLYVGAETYLILHFAEFGVWMSLLLASAFALGGALLGSAAGLLMKLRISVAGKLLVVALAAIAASAVLIGIDRPSSGTVPALDQAADASYSGELIADPSESGVWQVQELSYGSGSDKHRSVYGEDVDIRTVSVDASAYIDKWSWLKTRFWGFDQRNLPLNGRLWLPEGEGKHPVVLIVHGNHLMEYFSDGGYDYLGKLLASQGVVAISVDENFFNYSVWSGIPNDDMKMRAWLLLKHLQELQRLDAEPGNPLSGKLDLSKVALVGHSRGGQAVAMAADAQRWFADDRTLDSLADVHIEAVAAIAPTDKTVDKRSAQLGDVSYLTLQGARDADVNNFYGDRQYGRTKFTQTEGNEHFKAALYIADANHSQFNKDWGRMDERPPGGLFLSRANLLKPEEQRKIAEVYIGAFIRTTLLGEQGYKQLFRDYRSALPWLPDTGYVSRFEQADFQELARYEQGGKLVLPEGSKAAAENMDNWAVASAEDRDGNSKGTKGVELEWSEAGAEYSLELSEELVNRAVNMAEPQLVFSMANLERDLLEQAAEQAPDHTDSPLADVDQHPLLPEVEVELGFADGGQAAIELDEILQAPEPIYTQYTIWPWLDQYIKGSKFKEPNEPVFQTYVLPLEPLMGENTSDEQRELTRITFRFQNGPGKVMLDDIGLMPK